MDGGNPSRRPTKGRDGTRARTLAAAHDLFTRNGYWATTTKEISVRAGVAEPTLFRNFGSKAELFETSILEPFTEFIVEWTGSWNVLAAGDTVPELAQSLIAGLANLVRENRRLFQELMTARADPQSDLHQSAVSISTRFREGLRAVQDVGLDVANARGLAGLDAPATIAAVASMVIGSVLLEDWVTPSGVRKPGRTRMIEEMTSLVVHGIADRPA